MKDKGKKRGTDCLQSDLRNVTHRVKSAYRPRTENPGNDGEPDEGRSDFAQRSEKILVGQITQL